MKKFLIVVALLFAGVKYGLGYLTSDKFQAYGDRTHAAWTCEVNMILSHFYSTTSEYEKETVYLQKVINRCPDSSAAEEASFNLARSLENQGFRSAALQAYRSYAEKYPGTKRARVAVRAAGLLDGGG